MSENLTADALKQKTMEESRGRCSLCSAHVGYKVEVTPIVPLTEGGALSLSNLVALCPFCRWLFQRQRVTATAVRTAKKDWQAASGKVEVHKDEDLEIFGAPLRLQTRHRHLATVLEGSELESLLANFFNCLDAFLIHEDQHLENALTLGVIRAFRDLYDYVPPEKDIKEHSTPDSRKLDLLYRGVRALFSAGLAKPPKAARASAARKPATPAGKRAARPTARKPAKRKPAARKAPAKKTRR